MKIKHLFIVPILLLSSGCGSKDRLIERVEVMEYWILQQTESSPKSQREAIMIEKAIKKPIHYK